MYSSSPKCQAIFFAVRHKRDIIEFRTRPDLSPRAPLRELRGAGAGARDSIDIALASGMIVGYFFTLFVVPCVYL
jgi:multidrug efflux pump